MVFGPTGCSWHPSVSPASLVLSNLSRRKPSLEGQAGSHPQDRDFLPRPSRRYPFPFSSCRALPHACGARGRSSRTDHVQACLPTLRLAVSGSRYRGPPLAQCLQLISSTHSCETKPVTEHLTCARPRAEEPGHRKLARALSVPWRRGAGTLLTVTPRGG